MYSPLDESKKQVRLIHLLPGVDGDGLRCRFSVISLDDNSNFEALSYVWGDEKDRMTIQVEGQVVSVTRNLHQALKSLQYTEKERVIWADALCINQGDAIERGSQVKLMAHLYSHADCVVCYLGELTEGISIAMQAIHQIDENKHLHFLEWNNLKEGRLKVDGRKFPTPNLFPFLTYFFKKPWWTRVWTVQELVLAKRAILQCGGISIPSHSVLNFRENIDRHLFGCCQKYCTWVYRMIPDPEYGETIRYFLERTTHQLNQYLRRPKASLFFALALFRDRQSGNPRDKVYGMLGLAKDEFSHLQTLEPNYMTSTEKVFTHAAIAECARTRSLDTLSYCYGKRNLSLPSWVPDWTTHGVELRSRLRWIADIDCYNASGDWEFDFDQVIAGPGYMAIPGIQFDKVKECGRRFDTISKCELRSYVNEMRYIAAVDELEAKRYCNTEYTIEEAFRSALFGGMKPRHIEGSIDDGTTSRWVGYQRLGNEKEPPFFEAWENRRVTALRLSGWDERHYRPAETAVRRMIGLFESMAMGRRFIKTHKGYFGFGPTECARGDFVVTLRGGKVPYVLRRMHYDKSGQPFYKFLGDGYVQGIMDGEAFEGTSTGEAQSKTFRLR